MANTHDQSFGHIQSLHKMVPVFTWRTSPLSISSLNIKPYCFIQFPYSQNTYFHQTLSKSKTTWVSKPFKCYIVFPDHWFLCVFIFQRSLFVMYRRPLTDSKGLAKKKISGCCVKVARTLPPPSFTWPYNYGRTYPTQKATSDTWRFCREDLPKPHDLTLGNLRSSSR